jgi:Tol biopolymer transport system component
MLRNEDLAVHNRLRRLVTGLALCAPAIGALTGSANPVSGPRSLIAFARVFARPPQFRIFLIGTDGRGLRELHTGVSPSMEPMWSPDGREILFRGGARDDLYVIRPDGTGLRNLTHDSAHEQDADWSPDGTRIAYQRYATPNASSSIWVLRLHTGRETRLTPDSLGAESPSWSPDGSEIAFVSQTARQGYTPELWLMRADGSRAHHIFPALDGASGPVFAPRGQRMLISDQRMLYVMDARQGHPRSIVRLGTNSAGETELDSPQWSPDGTSIVFCQLNSAGRSQIWTVKADGRSLRRLTAPAPGVLLDEHPSWQPQGARRR